MINLFKYQGISPYAFVYDPRCVGRNTKVEHGAVIEPLAMVGENCFIGYFSIIRPDVIIGDNSHVRSNCYIAESVRIGKCSHIFQYSNIGKGTIIEDGVWIGAKVMITNTKNIAHLRPYPTKIYPPTIKFGARIASCVQVNPGVVIGRNSFVRMGSLVTRDIPDNEVWQGTPARHVDIVPEIERIKEEVIQEMGGIKNEDINAQS